MPVCLSTIIYPLLIPLPPWRPTCYSVLCAHLPNWHYVLYSTEYIFSFCCFIQADYSTALSRESIQQDICFSIAAERGCPVASLSISGVIDTIPSYLTHQPYSDSLVSSFLSPSLLLFCDRRSAPLSSELPIRQSPAIAARPCHE